MKKLIFIVSILLNTLSYSQTLEWVKRIGNTYPQERAGVFHTNHGSVLLFGRYEDTMDIDPDTGTANITSVDMYDAFLSSYDLDGNYQWGFSLGGVDHDAFGNLVMDSLGNIYLAGGFQGTVDFDPDTGTYNLTSDGSYNVFVAKYDINGNFIWAKKNGRSIKLTCI